MWRLLCWFGIFTHRRKKNEKPRAWIPASTLFPLCTLFVLYRVYNAGVPQVKMMHGRLPACAVRGRYGRAVSAGSVGIHRPDAGALAVAHQRAEVQSANVKALGNSYTAQRKMTHEFRGYLFALSDMLANGDTAVAQTYL